MKYSIRIADKKDARAIHDIYDYYVKNTFVTFTIDNPSVEEYAKDIEETKNKYPYLVAVDEHEKILGYVCGHEFRPHDAYRWCVESSLYLDANAPKRSGIGSALYKEFIDILGKQGYLFVYGVITDINDVSISLHEKLGFKKVGELKNCGYKNNTWLGIVYYVLQIGDLNKANEPIGFNKMMQEKR